MYKDPDKQREANRKAKERYKAKQADKAVREALGIPKEGIPEQGITLPEKTDLGNTLTTTQTVSAVVPERTGVNLDALGLAEAPNSFGGTKLIVKPKRGKDIKVFQDLPVDVQETILRMSIIDGKFDQAVKAKRTAAAIRFSTYSRTDTIRQE